jgi:hypothetical protein
MELIFKFKIITNKKATIRLFKKTMIGAPLRFVTYKLANDSIVKIINFKHEGVTTWGDYDLKIWKISEIRYITNTINE